MSYKIVNNVEIIKYLIRQVEESNLRISLSFHSNGKIIEGDIIKFDQYIERLLEYLTDISESIYETIYLNPIDYKEEETLLLTNQVLGLKLFLHSLKKTYKDEFEYVHLGNVLVHCGYGEKPSNSLVWRVKVSTINTLSVK